MTLDEFDTALLTYGAKISTWPKELQAPAQNLVQSSSEAHTLLEEMSALDVLMHQATEPEIAPGVIAARLQQSLSDQIEEGPIWSLLPIKGLLAVGSLAGAGGATAAYLLAPASVSSGFLLSMALGGMIP